MSKKILIIYQALNQEPLMHHTVINLRKNGLIVDGINSINYKFAADPIVKPSFRLRIVQFLLNTSLPRIKGVISKIVNLEEILLRQMDEYELIDFHQLARYHMKLMTKVVPKRKIFKITIWGSDFYRSDNEHRERQRYFLNRCDSIQIVSQQMKIDFTSYYNDFEDKIKVVNFGIFQYDFISKLQNINYSPKFKTRKYNNKLLVVCGYNGIKSQQHSLIINALNGLSKSLKDTIYVVFPMTYGCSKKYMDKVRAKLDQIDVSFKIIDKHLSNEDLAKLRVESDLMVNIQTSDAFSASLQEHLFAEKLLLVGDWLPYQILDENDVYYIKTKIENLSENLANCIVNFDGFKDKAIGNRDKMYQISSWENVGIRKSNIYKALLK